MRLVIMLVLCAACSNPYVNPQASKAVSEQKQVELLKEQNELLKKQTMQLERIANAMEAKTYKP